MEKKEEVFIGRLGKDPELKYTTGGKAICRLSVAVNKYDSKEAIWRQVIVWERQAEICSVQLKKGYEVFVQGQSQIKEFTNKNGELRKYEEVNARLVGFTNI